jgi:hypothetical protein
METQTQYPDVKTVVSTVFQSTSRKQAIFRKEGEFWTVGYGNSVFRLKDTKGFAFLAHLLRHPGTEFLGQRKLAARGVEIITRAPVTAVRDGLLKLSDERKIRATGLSWAIENTPNPLIDALSIPKGAGPIQANEYLEVQALSGVFG